MSKYGVILFCPSWGKACGVGEYTRYLAEALRSNGHSVSVVNTVESARSQLSLDVGQLLIVQHEYGLFDRADSYLSGSDSSPDLCDLLQYSISQGAPVPWVIMHTVDQGNVQLETATQGILNSGARVFVTHPSYGELVGAEWISLGVRETGERWTRGSNEVESMRDLTGITFGLLNHIKGISIILETASKHGFTLNAWWPTESVWNQRLIKRVWKRSGIRGTLSFEFIEDSELFGIMSDCDFVFLPQKHISHCAVSGSARVGVAMGVPVVTSDAPQFDDLGDSVFSISLECMENEIIWISSPANRRALSNRALEYSKVHSIGLIYNEKLDHHLGVSLTGGNPRSPATALNLRIMNQNRSKLRIALSRAKWLSIVLAMKVELRAAALGIWPSRRALLRVGG